MTLQVDHLYPHGKRKNQNMSILAVRFGQIFAIFYQLDLHLSLIGWMAVISFIGITYICARVYESTVNIPVIYLGNVNSLNICDDFTDCYSLHFFF